MDLKEAVATLNGSFSFGNSVLYNMCSDTNTDISNPKHLSDMIWLIGRAYAASPERRTYGYERDANGKVKTNNRKRFPLWTATNADDGKGQYFAEIAKTITTHDEFSKLKDIVDTLKASVYTYDNTDNDIKRLCDGIRAVELFNQLIRESSEKFDGLYEDNEKAKKARDAKARCKNQISFCSKFLHFCCPNIVFIIDQYSYDGGKKLIPQKKRAYSLVFEKRAGNFMDLEDVDLLNAYKTVCKSVEAEISNVESMDQNGDLLSNENEKISSYAQHCVRAYCVAKYLSEGKQDEKATPRLIDDLFLRIKKKEE